MLKPTVLDTRVELSSHQRRKRKL